MARTAATTAAALVAGTLLSGCSGSSGGGSATPHPAASTSKSTGPLQINGVTARQDAAIERIVPLMGGVQNTAYDAAAKSLLVYLTKSATARQVTLVRLEIAKLKSNAAKPRPRRS